MVDQEYKNLAKSGFVKMDSEPLESGRTILNLVQIRIDRTRKVGWHIVEGIPLSPGNQVVVETERGTAGGEVLSVASKRWVSKKRHRRVLRLQEQMPRRRYQERFDQREGEAQKTCSDLVKHLRLNMKVVDVEYVHWENRTIFYFVSEGRVDFRELVKELSRNLRCRIEMRQIGPRDETKMLGGLGRCGREHCCATFLTEFQSVRTKMAKEQGLVVNQEKITGHCRKLLCCLAYERDTYAEMRTSLPPLGTILETADGPAKVIELLVIRQEVKTIIRGVDGFRVFSVDVLSQDDEGVWVLDVKTLERQKQEELDRKMKALHYTPPGMSTEDDKGNSKSDSKRPVVRRRRGGGGGGSGGGGGGGGRPPRGRNSAGDSKKGPKDSNRGKRGRPNRNSKPSDAPKGDGPPKKGGRTRRRKPSGDGSRGPGGSSGGGGGRNDRGSGGGGGNSAPPKSS